MDSKPLGLRFMGFIFQVLEALKFEVRIHNEVMMQDNYHPDLAINGFGITGLVETKFYRSRHISNQVILTASAKLASYEYAHKQHLFLIVSSIVSAPLKQDILEKYGVVLWDRSNIATFLASISAGDFFLADFADFILEAQQGVNTEDPYCDLDESVNSDPNSYFVDPSMRRKVIISSPGQMLIEQMTNIPYGKEGWLVYEQLCEQMLQYIFGNDLSKWTRQHNTDDGLSRYDLICRIGSADDFWKTLLNSFNSRYILFEFKNYTKELNQDQIYTTERYLFPKALRGTSIIISRNGYTASALKAAKGSLRESGKLILLLSQDELNQMLLQRDNGDSPNDFLSDALDDFLMSLSR